MYVWAESKSVGTANELTLLTPIATGQVPGERRTYEERLREALDSVQDRIEKGIPTPISISARIHFARWVILRPEQYLRRAHTEDRAAGNAKPPNSWLLFTSNFDGSLASYLRDFSVYLHEDVDRIWSNCEGYPGARNFERFWLYARRHQINTSAFYAAYPELSVAQIQQLSAFRDRFDEFVARTRRPDGSSVDNIGPAFDKFLAEYQQFTRDFPGPGGTFDEFQARRILELGR